MHSCWLTLAGVVAAVAAGVLLPVTRLRAGAIRIAAVALVSAMPMTFVVAWTFSLVQPGRLFMPLQLPALFACVAAVQLLIVYATITAPAADGSALILMRMADAVALLDPRLGTQVHCRWWVAEGAVAGLQTEGQRIFLCLSNKTMVPVGRTFSAAAKARFAPPPVR